MKWDCKWLWQISNTKGQLFWPIWTIKGKYNQQYNTWIPWGQRISSWFLNNLSKRILYQKMLLIDLYTPQTSKCAALPLSIIIWFIYFLNLVSLMLEIITTKTYFFMQEVDNELTELSTSSNITSLISLQDQAGENVVY